LTTVAPRGEAVSPVSVCLLGSFRLLQHGAPVAVRRGGKVEQLLGSLALSVRVGIARDELLGLIWPDSNLQLAGQSLNSLVYSLRKVFRPALPSHSPILERAGRYLLNLEDGVRVDVVDFDAAVEEGDRLVRVGEAASAIESYQGALDLYRGDLAAGSSVQHLVERERLRARYLSVKAHVADHHFENAEYEAALASALQLLAHDPCREDAHRMAMRCYVRLGIRAQAVRQYRTCRQILADEFDALPESDTDALYDRVRLDPGSV